MRRVFLFMLFGSLLVLDNVYKVLDDIVILLCVFVGVFYKQENSLKDREQDEAVFQFFFSLKMIMNVLRSYK